MYDIFSRKEKGTQVIHSTTKYSGFYILIGLRIQLRVLSFKRDLAEVFSQTAPTKPVVKTGFVYLIGGYFSRMEGILVIARFSTTDNLLIRFVRALQGLLGCWQNYMFNFGVCGMSFI